MLLFLLIILLIFLLLKRFGGPLFVWLIQRQIKKRFSQAVDAQRRAEEAYYRGRPAGWSAPENPKRKVFDKSEGEYVKFKEIDAQSEESTASTSYESAESTGIVVDEQQIVDAEWEDI